MHSLLNLYINVYKCMILMHEIAWYHLLNLNFKNDRLFNFLSNKKRIKTQLYFESYEFSHF